jgi:hypothetical protein
MTGLFIAITLDLPAAVRMRHYSMCIACHSRPHR